MPVFKKWNSRRVRELWRHLIAVRKTPPKHDDRLGEGIDARPKNILKFGRKFLKEFKPERLSHGDIRITTRIAHHESPVSVIILYRTQNEFTPVGKAKLGFVPEGIVIEAIQGTGDAREAGEVNATLGQPWANRLIQAIEKNARKQGMKRIYLKDPATMYWFNNPATGNEPGSAAHESIADEIRQTMKNFYGIVAKRNGFRRTKSGIFVKEL